ncbi:MAG TPA: aldo/keto reductase [Candidatus Dormibacteraeota bacterium]|nr:aldo/keto reductase [Candidatus Dormibacteraeota bacterium]
MPESAQAELGRRRLGRTGHMSSMAILGMAAFWQVDDPDSGDAAIRFALDGGVNHVDVAPQYGMAQEQLGRTLPSFRDRVFLGCKSGERTRDGFWRELENSLRTLHVDRVDLHQFHAVCNDDDLDAILAPGGAAEALLEAREQGLTRWIGLTGHLEHVARVANRALDALDLDTIMLPVNASMMGVPEYRTELEKLFATAAERDLGIMAIKAIAKGPWNDPSARRYNTWYEPLDQRNAIQDAVNFTLSLPVTGIPTVGDLRIMPTVLEAVRAFTPLSAEQIEDAIRDTATRPLISALL